MRYYPVKQQCNLCAVSVCVPPVNVRALCLFALLFPVSHSFTPLASVLKEGLSHCCVGLMPRVLHISAACSQDLRNSTLTHTLRQVRVRFSP